MNKKTRFPFDQALTDFMERNLHRIVLILLLAGSVLLRFKMAPELALSSDYELFIKGWPEAYRSLGFVEGMGQVIGDYYVPFNLMYALIGLSPWEPWVLASFISSVFDYLLAYAVYLLTKLLFDERKAANSTLKAAYLAVFSLYLPVVFMNSALWKQCDGIYMFFAVLSVYLLLKDRATLSFVMLGISFSLKLQAIFFIPFFLMLYLIRRNFSILKFLWIPGIYLVAGIPAILCRRGIRATYGTYFMQMLEGTDSSESYGMVANYPNLYNYGLDNFLTTMALPAALVTMAILLFSAVLALSRRKLLTNETLLYLLAWQIWTMNMFLPSMHERYDYGAVVLFALLLAFCPRKALVPAAVLNIGSYITYVRASLWDLTGVSMSALTAVYIAAWVWTTWVLHRDLRGTD